MSTTVFIEPAVIAGMKAKLTSRLPRRHPPAMSPARQRAYRRALREAEMAAWESVGSSTTKVPAPDKTNGSTRLTGTVFRSEGEGTDRALYALMAFAVIAGLVFGGTGALEFGAHWDAFVGFVRGLLH